MTFQLKDTRKNVDPCTIVIFGASGDLTARKLIPALYHLFKDKLMPPAFRIMGFARRDRHIMSQQFRATIAEAAQALRDGLLVAFPTETVYGLGADAQNTQALEKLFFVCR